MSRLETHYESIVLFKETNNYVTDDLSKAMRAVYSGECTIYKAVKKYNVQERTLRRRSVVMETLTIFKYWYSNVTTYRHVKTF